MAALDDVKAYATGQTTASGFTLSPMLWDELKPFIASFFWKWYASNNNDILLRTGFLFIHFTIRVKDIHALFETLFGPEPTAP